MRVMMVDIETSNVILDFNADFIVPIDGDIIVNEKFGAFRVMQRAFVLEEQEQANKIVDIGAKKQLVPVIQLSVQRLSLEPVEDTDAISQ